MSALYQNDGRMSLRVLRQFMRTREPVQAVEEYCEMCRAPLGSEHRHLLDLSRHSVVCACDACALLFAPRGAGEGKYRTIPRRKLVLHDFQMADEQWDELRLPVDIVYLFRSSEAERALAFYPSPAGAMESLLDLESWETLVKENLILSDLEPDVEALLVNRIGQAREYFVVPIDLCYRLVGLLRLSWKGLSGGKEAWEAIETFFADLRAKASPTSGSASANQAGDQIGSSTCKTIDQEGDHHA